MKQLSVKRFRKTLVLFAIAVLVIATIFTLSACKKDPTVESISVEIIGGGDKLVLTQQEATAEKIISKIKVVAALSDETTKEVTEDLTIEGFDSTKLDVAQTVTVKYGDLTTTVSVEVKSPDPVAPVVTSIAVAVKDGAAKVTMTKDAASEAALKSKITVTAHKSDNTDVTVTDYTIEGLNLKKTNEDQTVTIKYGTFTKTIKVYIEEKVVVVVATDIAVEVKDGAAKVIMDKETASVQAIRGMITVTAHMSDNSDATIMDYTVIGLDLDKTNEDQTVTIKYEKFEKTITVRIEDNSDPDTPVVTDIAVVVKEGTKVIMDKDTASEDALREMITVSALKSDNNDETITNYTVLGLDLDKTNEDQTVTIKYGDFTKTVTVYIEDNSEPDPDEDEVLIKVGDGAATAMTVDPENENRYLSGDVTLAHGDVVVITLNDTPVAFDGGAESFTATYIGVHTFTVTLGDDGATIAVTEPATAYAITLKVGDNAEETPAAVSGVYTWTLTLNRGDVVTISDNMFGDLQIAGAAQYTVTRTGSHTITATHGATATTVAVAQPDLVVTLTVTRGGEVVNTLTRDTKENGEYPFKAVELKANDVVAITDNEGKTHSTYGSYSAGEWDKANSKATADGNYDFYVKTNEVHVGYTDTSKKVTIVVNDGTPMELALNDAGDEYVIRKVELNVGDKVKILDGGTAYTSWKNGIAIKAQSGDTEAEVENAGKYDFYVKFTGDVGIWVATSPEEKGVTISVNGGAEQALTANDSGEEYSIKGLMLQVGDTVVIKVDGEVYTNWKAGCGFTGTALETGNHDFYVKLAGGDLGIWVTRP